MYRLASLRSFTRLACLDVDARKAGDACPYLGEDLVGRSALVPVDEVQRDRADLVFSGTLATAAGFRVHAFDFVEIEHERLDLADQEVFFLRRQVAACANFNSRELGLDRREELDAATDREKGNINGDEHGGYRANVLPRAFQRSTKEAHVGPGQAAQLMEIAGFGKRQVATRLFADRARCAEQ